MLPWILCFILLLAVIFLTVKLITVRKSIDEICGEFSDLLREDTNRKMSVSSSDKTVRKLAAEIAKQLEEIKKLRRKYKDGDRELKEAVSNISHDLRTPITSALGYMELLKREEMSDAARRYTDIIDGRIAALKASVDELFKYSVMTLTDGLNYEDTDVRAILEETLLEFYGAFSARGIVPTVKIPKTPVIRRVDKSALHRVFENIVGNAAKYSDGDFSVEMTDDCEIAFSNLAPSLSAVDTARLFDRFYTLDTARRSTGLGLSIAKMLTEHMKGTLGAEYKDGRLYVTVTL